MLRHTFLLFGFLGGQGGGGISWKQGLANTTFLKEPRSGIRKPNCLVQFRDVSCIYKEPGYIPAESFDINK